LAKSRSRLDVALVERGITETRSKAQSLIMARRVLVNGQHATKPGIPVEAEDHIELEELEHPWVGRGGMKLAHALETFGIDVTGSVCADIGASTGGFTDVLLKHGALRVHAVDVGYGQLDQKLREDPRVVVRERINARYLTRSDLDDDITFVCVDVSFIPLRLIFPAVFEILEPAGEVVVLIKPQFEVGREGVGKGGIVRDPERRSAAVEGALDAARETGFTVGDVVESPVRGAEGNIEFLAHLMKKN
ncbi:MAG TPA: TlyA family RNA methyltransferase, partial [Thermoanaerobaculia bacterium]|nr:TlyA family RNA methyltransferase [Thermoanaerobaculia bacterium]